MLDEKKTGGSVFSRIVNSGFTLKELMKTNVVVLSCLLYLCFSSLSFANPLFGTWTVESIKASDLMTQLSLDRYKSLQPKVITFSEKTMGVIAHEDKENTVPVQYREEKENEWSFSIDEGKTWNNVRVQDADTLIRTEVKKETDTNIVYTLKRKK